MNMADVIEPVAGGSARQPRAVAMLVCERVIRDTRSDRASLIELFDEVSAPSFPIMLAPVSVYARLTDAAGFYTLTLDVVRRDDLAQVVTLRLGSLEAIDPLGDGEIVVHEVQLQLPSVGSYDVRLWMNGRFVHSVSLRALG